MRSMSTTVSRGATLASVVLTAALFDPHASDPVNVIKLSTLGLAALVVLAAGFISVIRKRVLALPWTVTSLVVALLGIALSIAAVEAPNRTVAILGAPGRNNGWLAYLAALVLLMCVLEAFDEASVHWVALALVAAGAFTGLYGLLQRLGIDAIAWSNEYNPIIAALGNPDFASAYLGICTPVAAWAGVSRRFHPAVRTAAGGAAVLFLVVGALSGAVQGPIAAVAGLCVVAVAVALELGGRGRLNALAALTAVTVAGMVVIGAGLAHAGPAAQLFTGISYQARLWYWRAALTMFHRNPSVGIGLDSYGAYWTRDRPLAAPRQLGGDTYSDSAHSVPLQHLAEGGLLLFLAYLALVVVVGVSLIRGLRTRTGEQRLVLGGLGGAWVAYQVQSLVSIDHVALLVADFVLAGAVVVAAGPVPLRELRLPGALRPTTPPPSAKGRRTPRPQVMRARTSNGLDAALIGAVILIALWGAWLSLVPLRASHAARDGDAAVQRGDGNSAVADYGHAHDLVGGYGVYWSREAQTYSAGGRPEDARRVFLQAFAHDQSDVTALRNAASLSEQLGQIDRARTLYRQLLPLEPTNAAVITPLAALDLHNGHVADALALLQRATRDLPSDADLIALLGSARLATGDPVGARAAWERSVSLMPGEPTATAGLAALDRQKG